VACPITKLPPSFLLAKKRSVLMCKTGDVAGGSDQDADDGVMFVAVSVQRTKFPRLVGQL